MCFATKYEFIDAITTFVSNIPDNLNFV